MLARFYHGSDWRWAAILAAGYLVNLIIGPVGYIGGGLDDWYYLNAARCLAEQGACLPTNHWEGRWPVFAPTALLISSFGETRAVIGIWPLISSIFCTALIVMVGNRVAESPTGWVAALLFLFTPAFNGQILTPSVEAIELACILLGVLFVLEWKDRRQIWQAFVAGLAFGFAFQVRETSLAAAFLAGIFVLVHRPRPIAIALASGGFLLPLAVEFAIYASLAGDPFLRRSLSFNHIQIPSTELLVKPKPGESPLLNPDYIANWRRIPGVELHWLIDGFLNLLVNVKSGIAISFTPIILIVFRKIINKKNACIIIFLYIIGIAYASIIIYLFALDPKPRVMYAPLVAFSISSAVLIISLWRSNARVVPSVFVATNTLLGLVILFIHPRTDIVEASVRKWIAHYPNNIETDVTTRRQLTLIPNNKLLSSVGGYKDYLLQNSPVNCNTWLKWAELPPSSLQIVDDFPTSRARLLDENLGGSLCLFRYRRHIGAHELAAATRRVRAEYLN